jgi:capsule polysaccharide export protein KpsE/RkpR
LPGTDTRQAIDAFNQENAPRIQALAREREAIRDELSRLAAASTDPAAGKSLSALLQEFTADVRQLDAPAGAAGK